MTKYKKTIALGGFQSKGIGLEGELMAEKWLVLEMG